jgi:MscS family membrane protein
MASDWRQWLWEARFLENSAWQWAGLLAAVVVAIVLGRAAAFLLDRQARRLVAGGRLVLAGLMLRGMMGPAKMLLLAGALHLAGQFLTLHKIAEGGTSFDLRAFWEQVVAALSVLAGGWFLYRLVDIVEHYLHRWAGKAETSLDVQLVPLIRKTLRTLVVIAISLFVAQNVFSWNIGALLAGLGIGGLAMALAAQSMLADIFGSIRILADRPFRPGETIRVKEYTGAVEEVGFRSTRIRTADGDLVIVPNSVLAGSPLENLSRRPFLRREVVLTATHGTHPAMLQRGVEAVGRLLEARKGSFQPDQPPRVLFTDFAAEGLRITVQYWFTPPNDRAFQQFNHSFNMELLQLLDAEGIELATPIGMTRATPAPAA